MEVAVGNNISALSIPTRTEVLINGVLQGRKQHDPKGASSVSRRRMLDDVRAVQNTLSLPSDTITPTSTPTATSQDVATARGYASSVDASGHTYRSLKSSQAFADRRAVKQDVWNTALMGWKRNEGDEDWIV